VHCRDETLKARSRARRSPRRRRPIANKPVELTLSPTLAMEQIAFGGDSTLRCHVRWLWLWTGTLDLLREQQPKAYAALLEKLRRHGLTVRRTNLRPDVGQGPIESHEILVALSEPVPTKQIVDAVQRFLYDRRRVELRGRTRPPAPGLAMVMAYYGARWYLKQEDARLGRRRLRGDALENRALQLVADNYDHTLESTRSTVRRTWRSLPPALKEWVRTQEGASLWEFCNLSTGKVASKK
jgi:hypothetical protein